MNLVFLSVTRGERDKLISYGLTVLVIDMLRAYRVIEDVMRDADVNRLMVCPSERKLLKLLISHPQLSLITICRSQSHKKYYEQVDLAYAI